MIWRLKTIGNKNWANILSEKFDHPAIVFWRAIELNHLSEALKKYELNCPILDLGCAEGNIAGILFKNKRLIGLDNCWDLIKKNSNHQVYKALVLADGCAFPFKNETVESIFSNCVIEHIPDLNGLLNEISRILNKRGIFIFTVPSHKFADFLSLSIIFDKLRLKNLSKWYKLERNRLLNHFHCYDHNSWRKILNEKGLNLIEYRYYIKKKETFIWDALAIGERILKFIWPLNYLLTKINKSIINRFNLNYDNAPKIGSALLLVAKKG